MSEARFPSQFAKASDKHSVKVCGNNGMARSNCFNICVMPPTPELQPQRSRNNLKGTQLRNTEHKRSLAGSVGSPEWGPEPDARQAAAVKPFL